MRLHTEVHDAFKVLAIGDGGAIAQRAEPLTLVLLLDGNEVIQWAVETTDDVQKPSHGV